MTLRPHRPGDVEQSIGELYERTRWLERLTSGIWVYVGSGALLPDGPDLDGNLYAPAFLNSWRNAGGGLQAMRFRWVQGGGIDIQGSATGGALGSEVFKLPNSPLYLPDGDEVRVSASDDLGNFLVLRILPTGEVIAGL